MPEAENKKVAAATPKQAGTLAPAESTYYKSTLIKAQNTFMPMITKSIEEYGMELSQYQKTCVLMSIQKVGELLKTNGLQFKDVDTSNLSQILTTVATLKLNAVSQPRECYFQLRNQAVEVNGQKQYIKTIELGIEGAGNDAILRNFGVEVKSVRTPLIVREGDEYTLPYFDGTKMVPPTWKPKSLSGKVMLVIYIIEKTDGTYEYAMADRESVAVNLKAHISNNLLRVPDNIKNPILEKIENMSLEEMLNNKELHGKVTYTGYGNKEVQTTIISPAWLGAAREAMIERKMRNNAIKKYPKSFDCELAADGYESTFEDYDQYRESSKAKPDPFDVIETEVNESSNTNTVNPDVLDNETNTPDTQQTSDSAPKNDQVEPASAQKAEEEMPY